MNTQANRGDWAGQVIDGRYPLLEWLGGSKSSSVFLTEIRGDQPKKAAIRLMSADGAEADAQIARWKETAQLSHPHLMQIYQTGRWKIGGERLIYAVTEYAEENLSEILPHRPLTPAEAREMLVPILDALAYLHGKGLVHGSLKPSNVLVVNDQVKLPAEEVQAAGQPGKPAEAMDVHDAPECAAGTISPAADLWSLGVTLVEALTQRPPVWERTAQREPVVPVSIAEPFGDIARECLRMDPARRCSVGDVKDRLDGAGARQRPADDAAGIGSFKVPASVLAVAAVVVIVVIAVFALRPHNTEPLPATAAEQQQAEPATAAPVDQSPAPKPSPADSDSPHPAPVNPQPEPTTAEPAARAPEPPQPVAERAPGGDGVVEQVLPNVLPKAVSSIHGKFVVRVRVTVNAEGNVSAATIESQGPSKYFANAALEASRRWKFKAAEGANQAANRVWVLQYQFKRTGTEATAVKVSR